MRWHYEDRIQRVDDRDMAGDLSSAWLRIAAFDPFVSASQPESTWKRAPMLA
jgi:hypothetical protein